MNLLNLLCKTYQSELLPVGLMNHATETLDTHLPQSAEWLNPNYVRAQCEHLRFDADLTQALLNGLAMFEDEALRFLAVHAHHRWFVKGEACEDELWPTLHQQVHPHAPLLYGYSFLAAIPAIQKNHEDRKVDSQITHDTLKGLGIYINRFRRWKGFWGFEQQSWLGNHFRGEIYRIGRLDFGPGKWHHPAIAFTPKSGGELRVLAADGLQCSEWGYPADASGSGPLKKGWFTLYRNSRDSYEGHPVFTDGRISADTVQLSKAVYDPRLQPGDDVLDMHIIEGEPLDTVQCEQSRVRAAEFFKTQYPKLDWKAFACKSWLLDPQFSKVLPQSSNIRAFQEGMRLVPCHKSQGMGMKGFVFDPGTKDMRWGAKNTSLRKAIVEHLENGGYWRGGACFRLK